VILIANIEAARAGHSLSGRRQLYCFGEIDVFRATFMPRQARKMSVVTR
jgi:hypothetical protein